MLLQEAPWCEAVIAFEAFLDAVEDCSRSLTWAASVAQGSTTKTGADRHCCSKVEPAPRQTRGGGCFADDSSVRASKKV